MKTSLYLSLTVLLCFALPAFQGCRQTGFEVVVGPAPDDVDPGQEAEAASAWEALASREDWDEERIRPRFRPPGAAGPAPAMTLKDEDGTRRRINPAAKGDIVLVVFWSMDSWVSRSAALHADYLVRRYGDYGVAAVDIVENPDTYHGAADFRRAYGLALESYYDDFSALRTMSRAAGREVGSALPCFFLVDMNGRIRFSKLGFDPAGVVEDSPQAGRLEIRENAPRGERIEDYLRRLIEETAGG